MPQNKYHWKKLKRYNTPNHARELTFSCYKKYPYFSDSIACEIFLDYLDSARKFYKFELWAYVIMPDHIHILIWPDERGYIVPKVLHSVKGHTAYKYKEHLILNTRESFDVYCIEIKGKKRFKFWQPGGGYDRNLWNAKPIHSAIDYIENNPVRAELVTHPDDWRWSSAWARENERGLVPDVLNIPIL